MHCFKCDKPIESAVGKLASPEDTEEYKWRAPSCAVSFVGGGSYGSKLYDSLVDGIYVELVICDACLLEARETSRLRHISIQDRKRVPVVYPPK